jgi:hypothetical protein
MGKKQKILDPIQDFKENPEKLKAFLGSLRESERPLFESAAKLLSELEPNLGEVKAQSITRKARAIEEIKAKFSGKFEQKSDPFFLLELEAIVTRGVIDGRITYIGGHLYPALILPEVTILADQGAVWFSFNPGLPKGIYSFYTDWYMVTGQKKCRIRCTTIPSPTTTVTPQGSIEKYTEEPSAQMFSGAEMTWEVESGGDYITFCIRNITGDYVACLGAYFLGIY